MFKNNLFRLLESQSGQALLIVVLVLVVALTVGLSVASRSITSLKNSQNQASSQKALSAAEAGVEQAIKSQNQTSLAGSFTQQYNANYQTSIASISGAGQFLVRGDNSSTNEITKGNPVYIWTTNYSASNPWADPWSGTLTIYWGDPGGSCANNTVAALEVSVISGSRTNPTLQRYAYDPCSSRTSQTGFVNSGAITSPAGAFGLSYKISLPSLTSVFLISVNPLYANTRVGASVGPTDLPLPFQGANITSTGTADNQVQRKVSVFQGFPQIPADLFPYALFSP
jgi:Tfp pilus assembly protein PilX